MSAALLTRFANELRTEKQCLSAFIYRTRPQCRGVSMEWKLHWAYFFWIQIFLTYHQRLGSESFICNWNSVAGYTITRHIFEGKVGSQYFALFFFSFFFQIFSSKAISFFAVFVLVGFCHLPPLPVVCHWFWKAAPDLHYFSLLYLSQSWQSTLYFGLYLFLPAKLTLRNCEGFSHVLFWPKSAQWQWSHIIAAVTLCLSFALYYPTPC